MFFFFLTQSRFKSNRPVFTSNISLCICKCNYYKLCILIYLICYNLYLNQQKLNNKMNLI